jgi:hypothetical protein
VKGGHPVRKKRAIQNTLGRLGMQAGNQEVVAALAEVGIGVTKGLVRQIKVEILKEAARIERQRVRLPERPGRLQRPSKIPSRRENRS